MWSNRSRSNAVVSGIPPFTTRTQSYNSKNENRREWNDLYISKLPKPSFGKKILWNSVQTLLGFHAAIVWFSYRIPQLCSCKHVYMFVKISFPLFMCLWRFIHLNTSLVWKLRILTRWKIKEFPPLKVCYSWPSQCFLVRTIYPIKAPMDAYIRQWNASGLIKCECIFEVSGENHWSLPLQKFSRLLSSIDGFHLFCKIEQTQRYHPYIYQS